MDTAAAGRSPTAMPRITEGCLDDPRVVALLGIHLERSRAETAAGSAHALDLSGLRAPDIRFWTAWDGDTLLGCGALRQLSAAEGEVKSMHTTEAARRRRVGSAMLHTIIATARAMGMERLSLETGSWDYFRPAVALYRFRGFVQCGPFAHYRDDPNSIFMTLDLRGT